MQAAVLDRPQTEPAVSLPLDLPSSILYPDFDFSVPAPASDALPEGSSDAVAPAFAIDSLSKADWAISRILEAEARNFRRAELAATLHERVDSWLVKVSSTDSDSVAYLSGLLRPYAVSEIAKQRRSRSLVLPSGTAQLRKLPDRLDIVDKDAALSNCESSHPEVLIVRKDLSRSVLKSLIVSQGEAVPGCEFSLGSDELYIRANA